METTLNRLLEFDPCECGWVKLLDYLGTPTDYDKKVPVLTILESNGIDDALWSLRAVRGYDREIRLYACWCSCHALNFFEDMCPNDTRPRQAIEAASLYAEGVVDMSFLAEAWDAAGDAQTKELKKLCNIGHKYMTL